MTTPEYKPAIVGDSYPRVSLDADGIMRIDYGRHPCVDLEAVQSSYAQQRALCQDALPVLVLGDGVASSTHDAEEFVNSPAMAQLCRAMAIVTRSVSASLGATVYLTYRPPPFPCRTFADEGSALAWLREFL